MAQCKFCKLYERMKDQASIRHSKVKGYSSFRLQLVERETENGEVKGIFPRGNSVAITFCPMCGKKLVGRNK